MVEYLVQGESLTAVADAIREKVGSGDLVFPEGFVEAIQSISAGNSGLRVALDETIELTKEIAGATRLVYHDPTGEALNITKPPEWYAAFFLPIEIDWTPNYDYTITTIVCCTDLPPSIVWGIDYKETSFAKMDYYDLIRIMPNGVIVGSPAKDAPIVTGTYRLIVIY